jgi:hypothetical protein
MKEGLLFIVNTVIVYSRQPAMQTPQNLKYMPSAYCLDKTL